MENQINITFGEVENITNEMRNLNSQLDDILTSVSNMMNELNAVWQSKGAEEIASRFRKFANRFVVEKETVEDYCKFLDYTVQTYNSIENTISANAANFE